MLNQNHLEQHHWIDTGTPVIFTIEGLYQFIQHLEIYSCVYLSKQMLLGHQTFCIYHFNYPTIQFSSFQYFHHPLLFYHPNEKKPS